MYTENVRSKPPRRAHSLPSRYFMPSEEMGQYENCSNRGGGDRMEDAPTRRRSAPARPSGGFGLFPLKEECSYGAAAPPRPPLPQPFHYKSRERKPKVYSSYAVDNGCSVHAKKPTEESSSSRRPSVTSLSFRSSASPSRRMTTTTQQSPSTTRRRSSAERMSRSPEQNAHGGILLNRSRKVSGPSGSFSWAAPAPLSSSSHRFFVSSSSSPNYRFRDLRDSSFEENEEYEYEEKQRRNSNNLEGRMGGLSLGGLRKPKINSWDSMGILGLTNKIWHDTKRNQESSSFMKSTGYFLRRKEEAVGSYIM